MAAVRQFSRPHSLQKVIYLVAFPLFPIIIHAAFGLGAPYSNPKASTFKYCPRFLVVIIPTAVPWCFIYCKIYPANVFTNFIAVLCTSSYGKECVRFKIYRTYS